jgi:hypothetical protein
LAGGRELFPSFPEAERLFEREPAGFEAPHDVGPSPRWPEAPPIRPADDVASNGGRWTRYNLIVADEFAASLGVDAVGPHDDFFELGDDSLTAVQVAIASGKRLGVNVPVPTIECGTVRA